MEYMKTEYRRLLSILLEAVVYMEFCVLNDNRIIWHIRERL